MFTAVFSILSLLSLLLVWGIVNEELRKLGSRDAIAPVLAASLLGVLFAAVAWEDFGVGRPARIKALSTNAIYEVVGAMPVDDNQWLILRDQDGDCLTYSWTGTAPTGFVKAVRDEGGDNYYRLIPFSTHPPLATQSAK